MRYLNVPFIAILIVVCGCVTDEPLSDPETAKLDKELLGHWVTTSEKDGKPSDEMHLFIGNSDVIDNPESIAVIIGVQNVRNKDSFHVKGLKISPQGDSSKNADAFFGSTTTIDNGHYFNVFIDGQGPANLNAAGSYEKWTKSKNRSCIIYKYEIADGKMFLLRIDEDRLNKLVVEGQVKRPGREVTASSLIAYIKTNGDKELFPKPKDTEALIFRKVR